MNWLIGAGKKDLTRHFVAEKIPWAEDRDSSKWIQLQQIAVAGNEDIGSAIDGNFQELIVLGIATALHRMGHFNDDSQSTQQVHKLVPVLVFQVAVKFRATQHFTQLDQGCAGKQQVA